MSRTTISSGALWEEQVGYSRAVRVGPHVFVAGTTASDTEGNVSEPNNPYRQTVRVLEKVQVALEEAGARLEDVVRTRLFVVNIEQWPEIARAHQEFFGDVRPAATMVEVQRLIAPEMLVEVEADAVVAGES